MTQEAPNLSAHEMLSRPDIAIVDSLITEKLQFRDGSPLHVLNLFEPDALFDLARKYQNRVNVVSLLDLEGLQDDSPARTYDIVHVSGKFADLNILSQEHAAKVAGRALRANGRAVFVGCKPAIRNQIRTWGKTNIVSPWTHEEPVILLREATPTP